MTSDVSYDSLGVFVAVADTGGFTAAALRLGLTTGGVSRRVRQLEEQLGGALFVRTTRRVRLTDAGRALYESAQPALHTLGDALARFQSDRQAVSGSLRLTAPVDYAATQLAPALARFCADHPAVAVELQTSDSVVDLVGQGLDLAIRLGHLRDSSLKSVRLGSFEQLVLASPEYLRRAGGPSHPSELAQMDWVCFTRLRAPLTWTFTGHDGRRATVRLQSRLHADTTSVVRTLLEHGAGASVLDEYSVHEALQRGSLQRLLPAWRLPRGGVYAVLPPGRYPPPPVRAFIDSLRQHLGAER